MGPNVGININLIATSKHTAIMVPLQVYGKAVGEITDDLSIGTVGAALAKELPYVKSILSRLFPEVSLFLRHTQLHIATDMDKMYECEVTDTTSAQLPLALSICMLLRKSFDLPIIENFAATGMLDPLGFITHVEDLFIKKLAAKNRLLIEPSKFHHIVEALQVVNCLVINKIKIMLSSTFKIRPLLSSEIDDFITVNVEAGFLSSHPDSMQTFRKAILLAEHIGVVSTKEGIKGGIMLFRRWHNAIWATNIFINTSIQSQGVSTAIYKYVLHYCINNKIPWIFCNPINSKVALLHQRWGILPINSWESVSLISLYNHLHVDSMLEIKFPFRADSNRSVLKTENEDMILQLNPDKQLLQVTYKHMLEKDNNMELDISDATQATFKWYN